MLNKFIKQIAPLYLDGQNFTKLLSEIDKFKNSRQVQSTVITNSKVLKVLLLKIFNLLVLKFQYIHHHISLIAKPFGLLVDPCNSCPLHCPGCIHGDYFRENDEIDWPSGLLSSETFYTLLSEVGPYAFKIHFFNWGEPLLNPNTPRFIKSAKEYGLEAVLSSNLSVNFDPYKLVESGLDFMILSIDGATPQTYNKYRREGDFSKVIHNLKRLIKAKQELDSRTPWLNWQFLTFKHNIHEIPAALKLSKELGVDSIKFAKPYDVSWADSTLSVDENHQEHIVHSNCSIGNISKNLTIKNLENEFNTSWVKIAENIEDKWLKSSSDKIKCDWPYKNLVMDAKGRILPCCIAPRKKPMHTYVYSDIRFKDPTEFINTPYFLQARANLDSLRGIEQLSPKAYCLDCSNVTTPNIDNDRIKEYFTKNNLITNSGTKLLNTDSMNFLTAWS